MVPELEESARDVEIQVCRSCLCDDALTHSFYVKTAITQKITRERVGDEIDKMMSGMLANSL